jgi:predicted HTH domain antitoxin
MSRLCERDWALTTLASEELRRRCNQAGKKEHEAPDLQAGSSKGRLRLRNECEATTMNRLETGGFGQLHFYLQYNGGTVKLEVEVNVADDAVDKTQLQEHLRKEAILALFADRKIPAGQATRELGLTRIAFMDLCQKRDIPLHDYTLEDYDQDIKALDKLWPEIEKNVRDSGARGIK